MPLRRFRPLPRPRHQRAALGGDAGAGGGVERRRGEKAGDDSVLVGIFERVQRVPIEGGGEVGFRGGFHAPSFARVRLAGQALEPQGERGKLQQVA